MLNLSKRVLCGVVSAVVATSMTTSSLAQTLTLNDKDSATLEGMLMTSMQENRAMCSSEFNMLNGLNYDEMLKELYSDPSKLTAMAERLKEERSKKKGAKRVFSETQVVYLDFETGSPFFPGDGLGF